LILPRTLSFPHTRQRGSSWNLSTDTIEAAVSPGTETEQ